MTRSQDNVFEEFAREFIRRHQPSGASAPSIERILVATDFSLCSLSALEYAEALARRFEAELVVMYVEESFGPGASMADLAPTAGKRELARAVDRLREHRVVARGLLRPGSAPEEIVRAAEAERASLIVMGTHGRSGVAHALMGSVAERVVRTAPCPVLTVRRGGKVPERAG